jgi:hypothetical protein
MERCSKCGNKLSNVDVLCPRCGALVEVIQVKNSFVPPPPEPPESTPPACERPNLVIYNEDFPGDEPVADEPASDESAADEDSILDIVEKEPDFPDLLPTEEDTPSPQPSVTQPVQPFLPKRLYENPQDLEREIQAESRMARRVRQRRWPEPQDAEQPSPRVSEEQESRLSRRAARQAASSASEEQLLKEADQLTSRASWRSRVTGMPDDAETPVVPEEPLSPISTDAELSAPPAERTIPRYRAEYRESLRRSGRVRKSKGRMPVAAAILLWIMVAAVLFLGFYYLNQHVMTVYGSYGVFINALTNGRLNLDASVDINTINVKITESKIESGAPSHTFTVMADGATSVRFFPTGDVFDMKDGMVIFEVPDESIALSRGVLTYDSSILVEDISLELTVGTSTVTYPIDPFKIHLISSEYTREKPEQDQSVTPTDSVFISLMVAPGATVFINNSNYSDDISDDGRLSVELPLSDEGDTVFVVDVMQPGRQAVKDKFTVTKQKEPTLLKPETEYLRTYTDSFECRGVTDPGATLSAQLNDKTFAGLVSDSGAYSVACKAAEYGLYSVTLTAAAAGKADTVATIAVERLPEANVFQSSARKMTAANAVRNAASLLNTGIRLDTEIGVVTTEGLAQKFSVAAGNAQLNCYYYGQTPQISAGRKYTLYGMMDEAGSFYVMFVE